MLEIQRGRQVRAQRVVIYAPEGFGKTTLAAKFPGALFIDLEDGTCEMDVARTRRPTSWPTLIEQVRQVGIECPCQTLVIDTIDWAEALCKKHLIEKNDWDSIESAGYGKGYTMLAEAMGRLLDELTDVRGRGINVVLTAHAAMRKFEQPDERAAYDRWELKLEKKVAAKVKEWADAMLFGNFKPVVEYVRGQTGVKRAKARDAKRVLYTTHNAVWDAKNRWGLDSEIELDFKIIAPFIPEQIKSGQPTPANAGYEKLKELCRTSGISKSQIEGALIKMGVFPKDTKLEEISSETIEGTVIGSWDLIVKEIS